MAYQNYDAPVPFVVQFCSTSLGRAAVYFVLSDPWKTDIVATKYPKAVS
jgi:hypothetical protein